MNNKALTYVLIAMIAVNTGLLYMNWMLLDIAFPGLAPEGLAYAVVPSCASDSMWPTVKCGDKLYYVKSKDYQVGDIIVFRTYASPAMKKATRYAWINHRIVRQDGNCWITQGDNNPVDDYQAFGFRVCQKDIIGKVMEIRT